MKHRLHNKTVNLKGAKYDQNMSNRRVFTLLSPALAMGINGRHPCHRCHPAWLAHHAVTD